MKNNIKNIVDKKVLKKRKKLLLFENRDLLYLSLTFTFMVIVHGILRNFKTSLKFSILNKDQVKNANLQLITNFNKLLAFCFSILLIQLELSLLQYFSSLQVFIFFQVVSLFITSTIGLNLSNEKNVNVLINKQDFFLSTVINSDPNSIIYNLVKYWQITLFYIFAETIPVLGLIYIWKIIGKRVNIEIREEYINKISFCSSVGQCIIPILMIILFLLTSYYYEFHKETDGKKLLFKFNTVTFIFSSIVYGLFIFLIFYLEKKVLPILIKTPSKKKIKKSFLKKKKQKDNFLKIWKVSKNNSICRFLIIQNLSYFIIGSFLDSYQRILLTNYVFNNEEKIKNSFLFSFNKKLFSSLDNSSFLIKIFLDFYTSIISGIFSLVVFKVYNKYFYNGWIKKVLDSFYLCFFSSLVSIIVGLWYYFNNYKISGFLVFMAICSLAVLRTTKYILLDTNKENIIYLLTPKTKKLVKSSLDLLGSKTGKFSSHLLIFITRKLHVSFSQYRGIVNDNFFHSSSIFTFFILIVNYFWFKKGIQDNIVEIKEKYSIL